MKIVLIAFAIIILTSLVISVQGCSNINSGQITGGACSIKELKSPKESNFLFYNENDIFINYETDINLSPFKNKKNKLFKYDCLFEKCLYKQLLRKVLN